MYRFGIMGNDKRMEYLYRALIREGHSAMLQGQLSAKALIDQCEIIIMAVGMRFSEISEYCADKKVFCGIPGGDGYISYTDSEYFKIRNAVPSAEGAISIMMQNTPFAVCGSKCAIVGYGNIGKCLCDRLSALGAKVTVYARSDSARAEAQNRGADAYPIGRIVANDARVIFNTVPAPILDNRVLENISKDTLIIDLASKPGGTDFKAASEYGIQVIHALSLPARCAPETAGEILKQTVLSEV